MTWSNPATWATGSTPGATDLNREIRDNMLAVGKPAYALVSRSTDQANLSAGVDVAISWSTAFQPIVGTIWSGGTPTQTVVPTGWGGLWHCDFTAVLESGSGSSAAEYYSYIRVNGSGVYYTSPVVHTANTGRLTARTTGYLSLNVGDYVEFMIRVPSGVNADDDALADFTHGSFVHTSF